MWKDNDVRFPTLEATGWGDTGFGNGNRLFLGTIVQFPSIITLTIAGEERTPALLKVTLKPIENSECYNIYGTSLRRLREGIKEHQICAGDEKMDTCPVGFLELKRRGMIKLYRFVIKLFIDRVIPEDHFKHDYSTMVK